MSTQYIRINNPKFLEVANGLPAAGYLVWTLVAGTVDTLVDTYSNRTLTSLNTNPVVLDAGGRADIFTNTAVKLVYTVPGGDLTNPIWTEDYASEQQNVIADNCAAVSSGDNNFAGTATPLFTSIPERLSLVITPDTDSLSTLGTHTFVGTGVNDLMWSGAYIGTTAGSIFSLEILAAFIFPPAAPTIVENAADGSVTAGAHLVKLTAKTTAGETSLGTASNSVTSGGSKKIDVSGIPALAGAITGYNVYMTEAGGSTYYLVATVTSTTYTINIDDVTLAANTVGPTLNTTGDGIGADLVRWKKGSGGSWHQVAITADPEVPQAAQEEIYFTFSVKTGHTEGDVWTQQVMTPVRFDFCGLSPLWLVYKNINGVLTALDAGDFQADIPVVIVAAASQSCWILIDPKVPVLQQLQPSFIIKEIIGNYDIQAADARVFLNCSGAGTISLLSCASFANKDVWIKSQDGSVITVNVAGGTDRIYRAFDPLGVTTITVGPGSWDCIRFASNGAYYVMVEAISLNHGYAFYTHADDGTYWTCPDGVIAPKVTVCPPGGGGSGNVDPGAAGNGAGAGGLMTAFVTTVPRTQYLLTIPLGGAGGSPASNGTAGGTASLGALLSATGGGAGTTIAAGVAGNDTGEGGQLAVTTTPGKGGRQWLGQAYGSYGNGGAGGDAVHTSGYDGQPAFILIEY